MKILRQKNKIQSIQEKVPSPLKQKTFSPGIDPAKHRFKGKVDIRSEASQHFNLELVHSNTFSSELAHSKNGRTLKTQLKMHHEYADGDMVPRKSGKSLRYSAASRNHHYETSEGSLRNTLGRNTESALSMRTPDFLSRATQSMKSLSYLLSNRDSQQEEQEVTISPSRIQRPKKIPLKQEKLILRNIDKRLKIHLSKQKTAKKVDFEAQEGVGGKFREKIGQNPYQSLETKN